jgi:hypothetical protein
MGIPQAQADYTRLLRQGKLRAPKTDADRGALYADVNILLDQLDGASLVGSPVTAIRAWTAAFDGIEESRGALGSIAQRLWEAVSGIAQVKPAELDALHQAHRQHLQGINSILDTFSQPDTAYAYFQRTGRLATDPPISEAEHAIIERNLVTRRNLDRLLDALTGRPRPDEAQALLTMVGHADLANRIAADSGADDVRALLQTAVVRQSKRLTPGTRGPDSAPFETRWHMPTIIDVYERLVTRLREWTRTTTQLVWDAENDSHRRAATPFPYVWNVTLSAQIHQPNLAVRIEKKTKRRQEYSPGPAEIACRLMGERTGCSWQTVKQAIAHGGSRPEKAS